MKNPITEAKWIKKARDMTEDDLKGEIDDTEKLIEKAVKAIDEIIKDKEKELMEV